MSERAPIPIVSDLGYDGTYDQTTEYVVAAVAMTAGLFYVFFSRRYYRVSLFLAGFFSFALAAFIVMTNHDSIKMETSQWGDKGDKEQIIVISIAAGVGILGGILMALVIALGLQAIGALGGVTAALYIIAWLMVMGVTNSAATTSVLLVAAVAGAVIGLIYQTHCLVVATAMTGGYLTMFGLDLLLKAGLVRTAQLIFGAKVEQFEKIDDRIYGMLTGVLLLLAAGSIVQYKLTSANFRRLEHKPTASDAHH